MNKKIICTNTNEPIDTCQCGCCNARKLEDKMDNKVTEGEWEVTKSPPLSNWTIVVNPTDQRIRNQVANLYECKQDANLIVTMQ
jgi:hypothetical protein